MGFKIQSVCFSFLITLLLGRRPFNNLKKTLQTEKMDLSSSLKKKLDLGKRMPRFLSRFCRECNLFHRENPAMKCHGLGLEPLNSP